MSQNGVTAAPLQMGSVNKALMALQRLGEAGSDGRALNRLAADLGLHKSSLHHTLSAMRLSGFVEQDSCGNYRLGPAALSLAESYLRDDCFAALREPLRRLSLEINEICHMGILAGEDIVYIHKTLPKNCINTWSSVGFRNPALTTALGRAIACQRFIDFESFALSFPTALPQRTAHTRVSLKDIWMDLVEARRRGHAREIDEYETGTSCVAVAILRGHRPIAAISITGPSDRISGRQETFLLRSLRACITPHLPPGLTLQATTDRSASQAIPA